MTDGPLEVDVLAPDGSVLRPAGPSRLGRGARLAIVALAVLALLGAVALAVSRLTAPSGAQSPTDAVESLLDAVESGDVIRGLEALRPAERDALGEPVLQLIDELRRLDVVGDDVDLSDVQGMSLRFDDVEYRVEQVDDRMAVVTMVGGTVTGSLDPGQVPLGATVRDELGTGVLGDPAAVDVTLDIPEIPIAVVRDDGAWYVSVWYSMADAAARRSTDGHRPAERLVEPLGAETPEGVVTGLVDAATALDAEAALALLDPAEAAPVYDYSGLFLPDVNAALADVRESLGLTVTLTGLALETERDGSVALVSLGDPTGLTIDATWNDPVQGPTELSLSEGCVSVVQESVRPLDSCSGAAQGLGLLPFLGVGGLFGDAEPPNSLVTVERDGRWYLSPGRTLVGALVDAAAALDAAALDGLIGVLGGGALPIVDPAAVLAEEALVPEAVPVTGERPAPEGVAADDERVTAITGGLPGELSQVAGSGFFDHAQQQRFDEGAKLTLTRVFQLHAGFADITVSDDVDLPPVGDPISVDGHTASLARFGDGVVIVGEGGRFAVQVSVSGLDRGLDPEAAARELYAATVGHLAEL